MTISDWIKHKEMTGGRFFTYDELRAAVPNLSGQVTSNLLNRLRKVGRIESPYRGFYVILPPEYILRGGVPPVFYMDDLLRHLGRNYYFSLLSAAVFWGAAHQRPQVDFVAIDKSRLFTGNRRHREVQWIVKPQIPEQFVCIRKGEAGDVRYSNAELTALDLVQYEHLCGGLSAVATVLGELLESTDFRCASSGVFKGAKDPVIRRLGYVVEKVLGDERQAAIIHEEWRKTGKTAHYVPLSNKSDGAQSRRDERWKIVVNADIEVDDL